MQALGTIEVVGLAAGIEAADVACKAANVELVGYELAKGGGYVTIKVLGQVGAVNAAIDAAAVAAARVSRVVSKLVIARPSDQVESMVFNRTTVGYHPEEPVPSAAPPAAEEPTAAPEAPQAEPTPEPAAAPAPATADSPAITTSRRKQA
ncbi:MAG TPA: BMC domain-containing protein [Arachnia sp.]|nr:BMC domain-containing protein [Arachnia sp.]